MDFADKHVLVFEGRARQSLPILKALKRLGCITTALCASKLDVAYVSRYCDYKVLGVCDNNRSVETIEQVRKLIRSGKYDVVIPTTDFAANILSEKKEEFSPNAYILSNDIEVFQIARDKSRTMITCMENNIPCPKTITRLLSADQIDDLQLNFPVVVKPRVGYGAVGFVKIESLADLKRYFAVNLIDPSQCVIQEYIPQTDLQYECAMFVDNNNQVRTSLVFSKNRWFPVEGGSSTLNITVDRPDIVESCTRLLMLINWRGPADIDLIQDPRDGIAKIMEINPRVSGSVKICFEAGVDQARQMMELAYDVPVTEYKTYDMGCRLRCSQTDLLWFFKSPNRWKTKPSWFSCYKTHDQIFSWDDPLPWFTFSLQGLNKYGSEMEKRRAR